MKYVLFALILLPLAAHAEVVPLAPLPTNFGFSTESLDGYINTLFYIAIGVGAVLAVLRIVIGGFQYMTSEAVTSTKDARSIITMAIVGLLVLLGSWLALSIINPRINNLNVFNFATDLDTTPVNIGVDTGKKTDAAAGNFEKGRADCQSRGGVYTTVGNCGPLDSKCTFTCSVPNQTAASSNDDAIRARMAQCKTKLGATYTVGACDSCITNTTCP